MNGVANLLILFANRDVLNAIAIGQSAVKVCETQPKQKQKS